MATPRAYRAVKRIVRAMETQTVRLHALVAAEESEAREEVNAMSKKMPPKKVAKGSKRC